MMTNQIHQICGIYQPEWGLKQSLNEISWDILGVLNMGSGTQQGGGRECQDLEPRQAGVHFGPPFQEGRSRRCQKTSAHQPQN